ncbi:MAG: hypothetical protein U5Q03_04795 [Bacteroidota bacterium]|nr:hypothetical protein [Bacteroidota bacterium]
MKLLTQITLSFMLTVLMFSTASGQDNKIAEIRHKFKTINQDTTYTTMTLDNEEFLEQMTDGGGQLTGYFKGDTIYKIHERIGVSYCVRTFEYYFWNGQLIFVFEKEDAFPYVDSLATLDYTSTETTFEGRYYFDQGKLIDTKIKGEKRISDDVANFKAREKKLLSSAKDNVDILTEKKE